MLSHRLPLTPVVFLLVLTACTPSAVPIPAVAPTETRQNGITEEAPAKEAAPTATTTRALLPTRTASPQPPARKPTTSPTWPPIEEAPSETPVGPIPTQEPYPPPAEPSIEPDTPGTVSGEICNPEDELPAMMIYFEDLDTSELTGLPIAKGEATYSVDVDPGQYIAYAYPNRRSASGGLYSEAVVCGLIAGCTDHNPRVFQVEPGQTVSGIDICDWGAAEYVPPNPAPVDPRLAGMVYRLGYVNFFRYGEDGQSHLLFFTDSYLVLSPDGEMGLFRDFEKNDLFTVEFSTGEVSNLTNTPQVEEHAYQWEPGLPGRILFTASAPGQPGAPWEGGLYAINPDGSNRMILDDEHQAANFAISPNAQTVAYGWGEKAFLYHWDSGVSEFNPRDYSAELPEDVRISSPDWSPDGKRIAWHVSGNFSEQRQEGYGIFDLEAKTFRLIHPSAGDGRGPGPPWGASWSPDGKWLAVPAWDVDPGKRGIWLVDVNNPDEEVFLGESTVSPVWSPDGKWLAYHDYQYEQGTNQVWLYNLNTGEHAQTTLPSGAEAVDW